MHELPALKLHYGNARAVCTSTTSGKLTEARRKLLRGIHEHMDVSERLGHGACCDVLIMCTKHASDLQAPGRGLNWLMGVARLGRPWATHRQDVSSRGLETAWQGWKNIDKEAYEAGVRCVYDGLGESTLYMYPIVDLVLLPEMIVIAPPAMRDVVYGGCRLPTTPVTPLQ